MVNKKKENLPNTAIPADHRVKLKEGEKRDKYLEPANNSLAHSYRVPSIPM